VGVGDDSPEAGSLHAFDPRERLEPEAPLSRRSRAWDTTGPVRLSRPVGVSLRVRRCRSQDAHPSLSQSIQRP
jgi:hypothetical protein